MMWLLRVLAIYGGAAILILFAMGFCAGRASAHDGYEDWRMPDAPSVSCCNNADCRPTRAYVDEDGVWRAWNGHRWLRVPPNKILPTDLKGDGRSHLCEHNEAIYCFSPAEPKS
jgi:hypothetical protein